MIEWQKRKRNELLKILSVPDLKIEALSEPIVERHEGFTLASYEATLTDGVIMPIYLATPVTGQGPYKPIIIFHGHADGARTLFGMNMTKPHQDYAIDFLRKGYAVVSCDQRGFAGRLGPSPVEYNGYVRGCRQTSFFLSMLGKTLLGERVGEAQCLVDFVARAPSLRTDQIVMTGNSGGGTTALYAAALNERIDVIVVASAFASYRESIMELSHCECNYVPGILNVLDEIWELGALVFPRPFLVIHGEQDPIFPIVAVRSQVQALARVYAATEQSSLFELSTHPEGHRYDHTRVFDFLDEHVWR